MIKSLDLISSLLHLSSSVQICWKSRCADLNFSNFIFNFYKFFLTPFQMYLVHFIILCSLFAICILSVSSFSIWCAHIGSFYIPSLRIQSEVALILIPFSALIFKLPFIVPSLQIYLMTFCFWPQDCFFGSLLVVIVLRPFLQGAFYFS